MRSYLFYAFSFQFLLVQKYIQIKRGPRVTTRCFPLPGQTHILICMTLHQGMISSPAMASASGSPFPVHLSIFDSTGILLSSFLVFILGAYALGRMHSRQLAPATGTNTRLPELVQNSREGIIILDELGRILDANIKACTLLNKPMNALVNAPLREFLSSRDQVKLLACTHGSSAGPEQPSRADISLSTKPDEDNRVSLQVDRIAWEGCEQAFAIRLLDITEQSTIQERLHTAYSIINTSPAVIFIWENKPGWPVIFVSDNVTNLLGYEPWDFLTGRIVYKELIHPQDLPRLLQDSSKNEGEAAAPLARNSYRLIHAQGSVRWVQEHVTGQAGPSGQITQYQGIIVDITAQKELEQALGQSETRFRSVLDSAPFPIALFDSSDRVKYVNPSFTYLTGYEGTSFSSSEELFQTLFPALSLVKEIKTWNGMTAWDTNNHTPSDNLSMLQDLTALSGETKHVTMIYGSTANREHYLILHDNTEQIKAEQENRRLQEYVYQTQKMEAIGTLSAGIAHEFNNLLQGIKGSMEMIRFKNSAPVKYLESMDSNILKASELVRDLLNFSQHNESRLQPIDINNIIQSILDTIQEDSPPDLRFDLQLDPELPQITADTEHIEHILLNLLNNAREAIGDQKTGCITVKTQMLGPDDLSQNSDGRGAGQGRIKLEISDSGRGMEPWIVKQIFDPFFSTKDVGQGTGLGLSTVYGLVKSYSGSITCTSKPGAGTTFTLIFPAFQDHVPDDQLSTEKRAGDESSQTILLIDDEPLILETVEEILRQSGYRVWIADRAHKALDMLQVQAEECSLVILDLGLPEMSGEACLQKINNLHPDKPVIVSSGYLDHPIAHTPPAYGAKAFLAKPYSKNSLLSLVHNVLTHPN